jgi:hypothetical protein
VYGLHAERPALQLLDGRLLGRDRLDEELALMTLPAVQLMRQMIR